MVLIVIILLIFSVKLTINVWKKSKRSKNQKMIMTIIYWILMLLILLILINLYFFVHLK